ncbi:MAG: 3-dehydroquinate synthase [Verrucomicrobiota bacterium]
MHSPEIQSSLQVELTRASYPILIGHNLESSIRDFMETKRAQGHTVCVVADMGFSEEQAAFMEATFEGYPILTLPSGETTKDAIYLERIYTFLAENKMDRSGYLLAVGGGVTGDISGFAAATFLRGIGFVQVPTTLLAMVDSSVGGKTGINIPQGKNLVGAFYQPESVFISTMLLQSLSNREFSAGMAEIIKYGMLGNCELFERLESMSRLHAAHPELPDIIRICCQEKTNIVQADERETASNGGRALLNLGHTFAHAIEKVAGYGVYLHGEAVSVGLVLAARFSHKLGLADKEVEERAVDLLSRYDLPVHLESPLSTRALLDAMQSDKKVHRGNLRFIVMHGIGEARTHGDIDESLVVDVIESGRELPF